MVKLLLNLIVKNESHVIERCLENATFADHIVISDTGSDDDTIDLILKYLKKVPGPSGVVTRDKWKNFGHNRTVALNHAYTYLDRKIGPMTEEQWLSREDYYICFSDADNIFHGTLDKSKLTGPAHKVVTKCGVASTYESMFAIRYHPSRRWRWNCPLHEYVETIGFTSTDNVLSDDFWMFSGREGARNKDPMKYHRDVLIFEEAFLTEPGAKEKERYWFYYAQSLKDALRHKDAIKAYVHRAKMGGWMEESYLSYREPGRLIMERFPERNREAMEYWFEALQLCSERFEAPYQIVNLCMKRKLFQLGFSVGVNYVRKNNRPACRTLFFDEEAHDWKLYDVTSVCAFYCNEHKISSELCDRALKSCVNTDERKRIESNKAFCRV